MHNAAVVAAFAAWVPATAILFRAKGPRPAVPIALLAGFILLPRDSPETMIEPLLGVFWVNKRVISGLALLVGILLFDGRTLLRARPRPLDLPMIAFVLLPLVSLAANAFEDYSVSLGQVWVNFAEWSLPYLAGRLYFGDRDGPRRLIKAVVVAGLCSVPLYTFEMAFGPRFYLAGLIYGIRPHDHMVARLGGWRPEGFQTSGIEVGTWMALAASMACWLWCRGGRAPRRAPAWASPLALSAATIACRGVYGYAVLGLGLASAWLASVARTRAFLVALALIPPSYIGARMSGAWDGHALVELAGRAGKAETVAYRLRAEDLYIKKVLDHDPLLGFGGANSSIFDFYGQRHLWPDGWWIHQLRSGGLVGLGAFLLALFLLPIGLALALPAGQSGRASPGALAWGLALFLTLHMIDSLQNMAWLTPTPLIGGALVGLFLIRRTGRIDQPDADDDGRPASDPRSPLMITLVVLFCVEVLGHLPRTHSPAFHPPSPEAASPKKSP